MEITKTEVLELKDGWFELKISLDYQDTILSLWIKPDLNVQKYNPHEPIIL